MLSGTSPRAVSIPMSVREILNLLSPEERATELDRLLDLRLGYSEASGSAELRGLIAAPYHEPRPTKFSSPLAPSKPIYLLFNELLSRGTGLWSSVRPTSNSTASPKRLVRRRPLETTRRRRVSLRLGDLRALATPGTRMIVVNTPHNPTGSMLSEQQLREIYALAEELDAWVLSDEAYRWLDLPGSPPLAPPMRTLVPGLSVPAHFRSRLASQVCALAGSRRLLR